MLNYPRSADSIRPPELHRWHETPKMEPGAPEPQVAIEGANAVVAYRLFSKPITTEDLVAPPAGRDSFADKFAVLLFRDVHKIYFGGPGEERLQQHPLTGLNPNAFYEVFNSPLNVSDAGHFRHWIVTFHDEMLEVLAREASVAKADIESTDAGHALEAYLERKPSRILSYDETFAR